MKKGIFTLSILSLLLSQASNAEYMIKIPLEPKSIQFNDAEVTGSINLNPATINRGETSSIVWDYTYADSITIEDVGTFNYKNGSTPVNPLASRSYNVEIVNGTQKKNEVLNLTVIQPNQNISFNANPTRIGFGQSTQLNWNVTGASSVAIDNGVGYNLSNTASYNISPTTSTTYTLTAGGFEGVPDKTSSVNVEVVPNAIINTFEVDKQNVTRGNSVLFSWNVANAESLALNPFGPLVQRTSGTQSIPFNTAGTFVYTLEATSLSGVKDQKSKTINVFDPATITSFKVNGQDSIDVSPNADLNFTWNTTSAPTLKLNGTTVSGTSQTLAANAQVGSTTYTLQATNAADDSVTDNVIVNVVGDAVINTFTAPTAVFVNSPFNLNWTATGANRYTLKSNNNSSGVTTTEENLNTLLTKVVTPKSSGSFTYTLSAYNTANSSVTRDVSVNIENDPTFTDFKVNGQNSINVSPSASLSFTGEGFSTGATLQGRNSTNATDAGLPSTASATAGTTTYYAAAKKSLNNVTRYSNARSVTVTVVNAPTIGTITAPTTVFANAAFTASWSGTNVTNYKIKSTNAASGIAITDVDLGTATSRTITPTAAGSYTYTITATNAAGVTTTKTFNVAVEANPTFSGFTVNGGTSINVSPSATLTFAGTGFSAGATLQGRDSTNASNLVLPSTASTTAGTTTYYAAATKSLNSVSRYSAVRSITVTVVNAPTIGAITNPTTVFEDASFTASWSGTNVVNYKIRSNNASSGIAITDVDLGTAVSRAITPTAAGSYTYTITATNAAGVTATKTFTVSVEANPTFSGFTVNGGTSINVSPSATLTFTGTGFSAGATLQGRDSTNASNLVLPSTASTTAGTTTYYAAATKSLNGVNRYSATRTVSVTVVNAPTIGTITAPTTVFASAAFTASWSGTNVTSYKIRSNNAASGIAITDEALGTAVSRAITPTAAGSYTYTITATNAAGVTTAKTFTVSVESNPTFTGFTVNGGTAISVAPSTALTFAGTGFSAGATLQGRNSGNTADSPLPTTASSTATTTTYYASAKKALNGVTRYSAVRSVTITVVANPVIGTITNPTAVFASAAFTASWSGTNVTSYKIRSNNAASGIAITDEALGTAVSRAITPTAAGSYTYTITATNSIGRTTTKTFTVTVYADPTISSFTASPTSVTAGESTTLSWSVANSGTLTINQSVGTVTGTSKVVNVGTVTGPKTYRLTNSRTLNGVTRSTYRDTSITVAAAYLYDSTHYIYCDPSADYANQGLWTSIEVKYGTDYQQIWRPTEDACPKVGDILKLNSGNSYTVGSKYNTYNYYIKKN